MIYFKLVEGDAKAYVDNSNKIYMPLGANLLHATRTLPFLWYSLDGKDAEYERYHAEAKHYGGNMSRS